MMKGMECKEVKKGLAFILVLALVLVNINTGICLAEAANSPRIYADQITASAGDEISIPVKLSGNTGMMGMGIKITYDKDVLTPQNVSMGNILSGAFDHNIKEAAPGSFDILWAGAEVIDQDGEVFVASFKVSDSARPQTTDIILSYSPDDTFDGDYKNIVLDCQNVVVNIGTVSTALPTNAPSAKPVTTNKPQRTVQPKPKNPSSGTIAKKTKPSKPSRVTGVYVVRDGKRKIWVSWNWKEASGYQVQYALNKKFTKGRKSKNTSSISVTLKKLKRKRVYYIRVRAYKRINGKKLHGPWSKVKKCKIK